MFASKLRENFGTGAFGKHPCSSTQMLPAQYSPASFHNAEKDFSLLVDTAALQGEVNNHHSLPRKQPVPDSRAAAKSTIH